MFVQRCRGRHKRRVGAAAVVLAGLLVGFGVVPGVSTLR